MTIRRNRGDITFECDRCEREFTLDSDDFDLTWQAAKREGWKAEKVGKDWLHECTDCGGTS